MSCRRRGSRQHRIRQRDEDCEEEWKDPAHINRIRVSLAHLPLQRSLEGFSVSDVVPDLWSLLYPLGGCDLAGAVEVVEVEWVAIS